MTDAIGALSDGLTQYNAAQARFFTSPRCTMWGFWIDLSLRS
ncbi:Unknown protein sequence [Pseudomonas syringae pv. syringae]|jgi:hypothetical protein|nr:hypothetical protein [Pseudomonas syringae]KPB27245.1 Unknown protein sequence [Pseudomonas syringae pv. syringae]